MKPTMDMDIDITDPAYWDAREAEMIARHRAARGKKVKRETDYQREIGDTLVACGFLVVRVNSAQMWREEYRRKDGSVAEAAPMWAYRVVNGNLTSGHSDLVAFRGGRAWFIEVKREGGKQSKTQAKFQELCERFGMTYVILHDRFEAKAWVDELKGVA